MTRVALMPYLTATGDAWQRSDWLASVDGQPFAALPGAVSAWDYDSLLALQENTAVDVDVVRESCGLTTDAGLLYVVVAECEAAGRRDVAFGQELPERGPLQIRGSFTAAAGALAGSLRLTRQIVLAEPDGSPPPAAGAPGAILLSETATERTDIQLEDDAGRFPTEVVNFTQSAYPGAVWSLSVNWDAPEESFAAAVRLSLNSALPIVDRLLADPTTDESIRVFEVIRWDIQRQLLLGAAKRADEFDRDDFPDDSLGDAIQRLVRNHLGLAGIGQLRSKIDLDTNFEELAQARAGLFHD